VIARKGLRISLLSIATFLALGVEPAHADLVIDEQLCFQGASGTLSFSRPTITSGESTTVTWHLNLPTQCNAGAGPSVSLVGYGTDGTPIQTRFNPPTSLVVTPGSAATWYLKFMNSAGTKVLATADIDVKPVTPLDQGSKNVTITGGDDAQRVLFLRAVATPNAVVRVASGVTLDLSGQEYIALQPGVQILGDRWPSPPTLVTYTFPNTLFAIGSDPFGTVADGVRISNLNLYGGSLADGVGKPDSFAIRIGSSVDVEIDRNTIYGWRGGAVNVEDGQGHINIDNAHRAVRVHDNYIHHNQHKTGNLIGGGHGTGYGVVLGDGAYALIERNAFDYNRHAIAGDGRPGTGYLAYRNLILPHGGNNTDLTHTHQIDMHGREHCFPTYAYNCGPAGEFMDVAYNTVLYTEDEAIKLRGTPSVGMNVQHNVFAQGTSAVSQTESGLNESDNLYSLNTFDETKNCDFDGDSVGDDFVATGVAWWYYSSARARWEYLHQSFSRVVDVEVGDADADGLCDVTDVDGTIATAASARVLSGPVTQDGRADLVLTGRSGLRTLPVAASNGNGTFTVTNTPVGDFADWAAAPGVKHVSGDFNQDGKTDIALLPGPDMSWWYTLPVAFSNGNGTFTITNLPANDFAVWAQAPGARALTGDFNQDGKTDIALLPGPDTSWWYTLPVAFSNGNGTFNVTNTPLSDFAGWAQVRGSEALTGDFNQDGKTDIALLPGPGTPWWYTLPVAFSNGNGTFNVTNTPLGEFAAWAQAPGARAVTGDFNQDGKADIALLPGPDMPWWYTLPVAFSNGNGTFNVTNTPLGEFAAWAQAPGVKVLTGDFNQDGKADIALLPGPNTPWWYTLPVAFSNGNGTFTVTNTPLGEFAAWAQVPGARAITGDFNQDGKTDIALTGAPGWTTLPVAFSNGNGTFNVTNAPINDFARWAAP
jgi:VCBS repeat protein